VLLERFVCGRTRANAYLLAPADERAIIVDAGVGAAERVIDVVEAEGLVPQAIVLTHGHPDHIWTAARLADRYEIPAYIHAADASWFADPATGGQLRGVRLAGRALGRARRMRPRLLEVIDDNATIAAGPISVSVMHTPGHSRGSVCFLTSGGDEQVCFAGDTVFRGSIGHAVYPGGDRRALADSIRGKLLPLPDDLRLLPGHGKASSVGAERAVWNEFLGRT
jgi:hydroxyacylglutathione hydrolase